jgi:quercetin dioxygenase-like cupin family protein
MGKVSEMGHREGIAWRNVPVEEVLDGVTRRRHSGETFTIVRYTYQPGSVFPVHAHPEEQLTIVHSGAIEFQVDGQPVRLEAGMFAVIPGGIPHGARVIGNEAVVSDNYIAAGARTELQWSRQT